MDVGYFKKKFLYKINNKISESLGENVLLPLVYFEDISNPNSFIIIDLNNLVVNIRFNIYTIKTIRFFFKSFGDIIRSYLYVVSEEIGIKFIFQNKEVYTILLIKYPAEMEILDSSNNLVTITQF